MEADMVAEILLAAYQERQRLESLLRTNPEFQKLEGVRRIIDLYEQATQALAPAVSILRPDPPESNSRPALPPDQPANISRPSAHSEQSDRTSRRRWTWGDSQSAHIRDAAAEYLRGKGRRATSGEIYEAIASKGIEIGSRHPGSYVAGRLSAASGIFDHSPDGYGLREWREHGPSEDERIG
jgi:hypothetical protein